MAHITFPRFCVQCDRETAHTKERPNPWLHLVLSIISAGLWLPVWFFLVLLSAATNHTYCGVCRTPFRSGPATQRKWELQAEAEAARRRP